jgi:hypothetical protein
MGSFGYSSLQCLRSWPVGPVDVVASAYTSSNRLISSEGPVVQPAPVPMTAIFLRPDCGGFIVSQPIIVLQNFLAER